MAQIPPGPPDPPRALVVEDELALAGLVGNYLERDGFTVRLAHDGPTAVSVAREMDPDVVVLDLGLPGLDGVEVCRRLRTFSDAYVVMLTARSDEVDTLVGLSVGADDYMTKPFSPRELIARVRAMLRRPRRGPGTGAGDAERRFGALTIDPEGREVWLDGRPVPLTRTEFDLLATLLGATGDGVLPPPARRDGVGAGLGRRRAPRRRARRPSAPQAR